MDDVILSHLISSHPFQHFLSRTLRVIQLMHTLQGQLGSPQHQSSVPSPVQPLQGLGPLTGPQVGRTHRLAYLCSRACAPAAMFCWHISARFGMYSQRIATRYGPAQCIATAQGLRSSGATQGTADICWSCHTSSGSHGLMTEHWQQQYIPEYFW